MGMWCLAVSPKGKMSLFFADDVVNVTKFAPHAGDKIHPKGEQEEWRVFKVFAGEFAVKIESLAGFDNRFCNGEIVKIIRDLIEISSEHAFEILRRYLDSVHNQ